MPTGLSFTVWTIDQQEGLVVLFNGSESLFYPKHRRPTVAQLIHIIFAGKGQLRDLVNLVKISLKLKL